MKNENEKSIDVYKTGNGVASLVTGILSLVLIFMPYLGLPLAIFAIVYAHLQCKEHATGLASAGRVLGILGVIFNTIILAIMIIFIFSGWLISRY